MWRLLEKSSSCQWTTSLLLQLFSILHLHIALHIVVELLTFKCGEDVLVYMCMLHLLHLSLSMARVTRSVKSDPTCVITILFSILDCLWFYCSGVEFSANVNTITCRSCLTLIPAIGLSRTLIWSFAVRFVCNY